MFLSSFKYNELKEKYIISQIMFISIKVYRSLFVASKSESILHSS